MTNREILDNLVLLHRAFCGLYTDIRTEADNRVLCGVQTCNVNLPAKAFCELFGSAGTIEERNASPFTHEVTFVYKNVKFITLLTADEAKELYNVE